MSFAQTSIGKELNNLLCVSDLWIEKNIFKKVDLLTIPDLSTSPNVKTVTPWNFLIPDLSIAQIAPAYINCTLSFMIFDLWSFSDL